MPARSSDSLLGALRLIWRRALPRRLRYAIGAGLSRDASRLILATAVAAGRPLAEIKPGPLLVSGFFSETSGVGRAAGMTLAALEDGGFSPLRHDLRDLLDSAAEDASLPGPAGGCWLIHANAPEAVAALSKLGPGAFRDRYRIGYWAWELSVAPPSWIEASRFFDEIWVPSQYVADALRQSHGPVVVMPHPVPLPPLEPGRLDPARPFTILTVCDMRSDPARKNPLGAIEAFRLAFPEPTDRARIVVKVLAADARPHDLRALNPDQRPDIEIIDAVLSDQQMADLAARSHAFLSLHRAEGFGLGMAEAMAAGRPVIATDWSGNLQFMDHQSAALVSGVLTPVPDDNAIYGRLGAVWAEPDLAAAAAWLRRLADDPALREDLGRRGRERAGRIWRAWSPEALAKLGLKRFLTSPNDLDI